LWYQPATLAEIRHLFAEGRAQLGRRQARNAVEFALAVNLLGVNRGVKAFTRYGFLKRNGLAFMATPLGRVDVTLRPQARLLDDPPLAGWIGRLRSGCLDKDKAPSRYQRALRQIDQAMFAFSTRPSGQGNDAKCLLDVLRALGRAEQALATGLAFCKDRSIRPLQGLSGQWLDQADDGSSEFRLAASLAGIRPRGRVGPLRVFLEEVEEKHLVNWSPGSTSAVWSKRPLEANLAAVFGRRLMEAFRDPQVGVPLWSPRPARLADVIAFLHDDIDAVKLADLVWGMSALDWSVVQFQLPDLKDVMVPFEFGVPRLLVERRSLTATHGRWQLATDAEPHASPDPDVFHILASGQADAVPRGVDRAARRLRSVGLLVHGFRNRERTGRPFTIASPIPAHRLLAAMLFPLSDRDLEAAANTVLYPPEIEE
jgi:CRISPR-associated protein Csx17